MRPSSFLYPSPTSPILRRRNNGAMIHFDRQQSARRGENAWSPQPPSPTKGPNSAKTLTPDDFMSAELLDSDHDVGSITWYPFDWRTGGPNPTYSPLRKLLVVHPSIVSLCLQFIVLPCVNSCRINCNKNYVYMWTLPLVSLVVASRLLTHSTKQFRFSCESCTSPQSFWKASFSAINHIRK